jgi:predicted O-methyltransferase YrrM
MKFDPATFKGMYAEEQELFRKWIGNQQGTAVEIGCMDGYSTSFILANSNYNLTTIDPFIPDSCDSKLIGNKDRFTRNVSPWSDRVTLIQDYSWNVAKTWNKPLVFLYIDGDHTRDAVQKDYDQWTPFLEKGGILAMHDALALRPGGRSHWPGPSEVALVHVFGDPSRWSILGETQSLVLARKL